MSPDALRHGVFRWIAEERGNLMPLRDFGGSETKVLGLRGADGRKVASSNSRVEKSPEGLIREAMESYRKGKKPAR